MLIFLDSKVFKGSLGRALHRARPGTARRVRQRRRRAHGAADGAVARARAAHVRLLHQGGLPHAVERRAVRRRILFPKSGPVLIITTKIHSLSMLKIQLECMILKHSLPRPLSPSTSRAFLIFTCSLATSPGAARGHPRRGGGPPPAPRGALCRRARARA